MKINTVNYNIALLEMWSLTKLTDQAFRMLKLVLIVVFASTASLAQGTVMSADKHGLFLLIHRSKKFSLFFRI